MAYAEQTGVSSATTSDLSLLLHNSFDRVKEAYDHRITEEANHRQPSDRAAEAKGPTRS